MNFLKSTADAAQYVCHRKCLGEREGGSGKGIWASADRDIIAFLLPPFPFCILHIDRDICIQIEIYLSTWLLILILTLFCLGSGSRFLERIAYLTCCLVGVKRRHRFVSGFQGCAFFFLVSSRLLPMRIVAHIISVTENTCRSGARTVNFRRFPLLAQRFYTTYPALFATSSIGRRKSSSMASESLNSSQTDVRDHSSRGSPSQSHERLPHAAAVAAGGKAASPAFFPLGYREGFSQWVCGLPEQTPFEEIH